MYTPAGMRVAKYRYEMFWLPLSARHRRDDIAPPLDVAWAWLMHALAPSKYAADLERILGAPLTAVRPGGPLRRSPEAIDRVSQLDLLLAAGYSLGTAWLACNHASGDFADGAQISCAKKMTRVSSEDCGM